MRSTGALLAIFPHFFVLAIRRRRKPAWFSNDEISININKIASVHIETGIIWSDSHPNATQLHSRGFRLLSFNQMLACPRRSGWCPTSLMPCPVLRQSRRSATSK
jgi:hypothetical protein